MMCIMLVKHCINILQKKLKALMVYMKNDKLLNEVQKKSARQK